MLATCRTASAGSPASSSAPPRAEEHDGHAGQARLQELPEPARRRRARSGVWYHYPKTWDDAKDCPPWSPGLDLAALPRAATVLSPHRGGAVGLPETEARRYAAVAKALNAVAKSGDFRRLATDPIGTLDIDAGY